jgi:hypothetical protein
MQQTNLSLGSSLEAPEDEERPTGETAHGTGLRTRVRVIQIQFQQMGPTGY